MKRGQVWSVDFTLSLLLFTASMLVGYTIITNTVPDDSHDEILRQAINAAELLAGTGYPVHWTNDTVIRAGLSADDKISLRKAKNIARLSSSQLHQSLRITDNIYMYLFNETEDTVPLFGVCGVGDLSVSSTIKNGTVPAIAIVNASGPFTDELRNITIYANISGYAAAREQDVVVLAGDLSSFEGITPAEAGFFMDRVAERGVTIVIVGDVGVPMLGVDPTIENASNLSVQFDYGEELGFGYNETLNLTAGPEVSVHVIQEPLFPEVDNYRAVALTDKGGTAYATWTYHDARIWYIGSVLGTTASGLPLIEVVANATQRMIEVPRPTCSPVIVPSTAQQVSFHDRTFVYHDDVYTLRTLVWRT